MVLHCHLIVLTSALLATQALSCCGCIASVVTVLAIQLSRGAGNTVVRPSLSHGGGHHANIHSQEEGGHNDSISSNNNIIISNNNNNNNNNNSGSNGTATVPSDCYAHAAAAAFSAYTEAAAVAALA
jgi:hypothetical protein